MFDQYNREINYLRVSITDRCNLRCVYCMPKEGVSRIGHDDILRYEEMLRIVRGVMTLGIRKIRVTGGEPLIRRGVLPFIRDLTALPGLDDISLTTNGLLLEPLAAGLFTSGISRINISLDSLKAEKYARITRGGDLDAVLRGIEAVHRQGFDPIKINIVVAKGFNDDELVDFAALTLERPYQVRFIELMALGGGATEAMSYLSNQVVEERIREVYPLVPVKGRRKKTDGPAKIYKIPRGLGEIGFISPISQHLCQDCNRLRLTADGQLRTCLLSDDETDIKTLIRSGCTDETLVQALKKAIADKPLQRPLRSDPAVKKCMKPMTRIGG